MCSRTEVGVCDDKDSFYIIPQSGKESEHRIELTAETEEMQVLSSACFAVLYFASFLYFWCAFQYPHIIHTSQLQWVEQISERVDILACQKHGCVGGDAAVGGLSVGELIATVQSGAHITQHNTHTHKTHTQPHAQPKTWKQRMSSPPTLM